MLCLYVTLVVCFCLYWVYVEAIIAPCPLPDFTCPDGSCIPMRKHCDGKPDCPGNHDEIGCADGNLLVFIALQKRYKFMVNLFLSTYIYSETFTHIFIYLVSAVHFLVIYSNNTV